MSFKTLEWKKGRLYLLDQTRLPLKESYAQCSTYREVARAIKDMVVRGAPAIGAAAAFGLALGARESKATALQDLITDMDQAPGFSYRLVPRRSTSSGRWQGEPPDKGEEPGC